MLIQTKEFGEIEVQGSDIIHMESPIFGYEDMEKYVLLMDEEVGEGLEWLQSVDEQGLCFILVNPEVFGLVYHPQLPEDLEKKLELTEDNTSLRLIAVVPEEDFLQTRVNLKCPIVINAENKKAAQALLEADYPIRFNLFVEDGEVK